MLGLPGMDPLGEELMLWRDIQLVKKTRTRYHAQHISTAGAVKIIAEAKAEGLPVSCEVTPHHLLLTDNSCADYDTNFKVNPPVRTSRDIQALKQAIKDGLVDALATDHAPHLKSEKELEFLTAPFGIASLECALPMYVKALIEPGIIALTLGTSGVVFATTGGAFIIEWIFAWPGMGRLFYKASNAGDIPVTMGILLIIAVLVVVFQLITDILYTYFDPRIRYE